MKDVIVLVDDEQDILDFIGYNLEKEGFKVYTADNGHDGVNLVKKVNPSLVVLDVMMPKMDGIEACQIIRDSDITSQPVISFLTSRGEEYSQLAGFAAGADDYITKPIRPRLLISKVKSLLRRANSIDTQNIDEHLSIEHDNYVVKLNDQEINLPKKEFELLSFLYKRPGKVFSRDQILSRVWGEEIIVGERTVDVHVRKLREKIGNDYIRTIKGVGYTFNVN